MSSGHLQCPQLYRHDWQSGDLAITDNLSLVHIPGEETQRGPGEGGTRILHRIATGGGGEKE